MKRTSCVFHLCFVGFRSELASSVSFRSSRAFRRTALNVSGDVL